MCVPKATTRPAKVPDSRMLVLAAGLGFMPILKELCSKVVYGGEFEAGD
jgi:hypothetical protein